MPACAADESPCVVVWESAAGSGDWFGFGLGLGVFFVTSVDPEVVGNVGVEDVAEDVFDVVKTTAKRDDFASQVADACGLDGSTSKRATPVSQQLTVWSQQ